MKSSTKFQIIGASLTLIGIILAIVFFSWKLAVIILISIAGNNLEVIARQMKEKENKNNPYQIWGPNNSR